jgi:hypothetical protein
MSVTYFIPNTVYVVAGNPSLRLLCVKVSRTFTQFRVLSCNVQNPALQVGQVIRRKNFGSTTGPLVWPLVREAGQPAMNAITTPPIDPFWANLCPASGAISVSSLANAMPSSVLTSTGAGVDLVFSASSIFGTLGASSVQFTNPSGFASGTLKMEVCLINDTPNPVTPRFTTFGNYHAVNISSPGYVTMTWNGGNVVGGATYVPFSFNFTAPAPIPSGVSTKSTVIISISNLPTGFGSIAGYVEFGYSL